MEDRYYRMALKAENSLCKENERVQGTRHSARGHNGDRLQGTGEQVQVEIETVVFFFSFNQ